MCWMKKGSCTVLEDSLHVEPVGRTGLVVSASLEVIRQLPGSGIVDDAGVGGADGICTTTRGEHSLRVAWKHHLGVHRATGGSWRLEKTSEITECNFNPRSPPTHVLKCHTHVVLEHFRGWFQCLTTLSAKKLSQLSNLNLPWRNSRPSPFIMTNSQAVSLNTNHETGCTSLILHFLIKITSTPILKTRGKTLQCFLLSLNIYI